MEIQEKHNQLLEVLFAEITPWRKLTIGIDGADGVGKSPLARLLSWQLGMPYIETDMFLIPGSTKREFYYDDLYQLINRRHSLNRPVIIEGVKLLETLEIISIVPDFNIYVKNEDFEGSESLRETLEIYTEKYSPIEKADYIITFSNLDFQ